MPDIYDVPSIFSSDPRTGTLTASQLDTRRKIAVAMAAQRHPYPKTIGEGLAELGAGLGEGYFNSNLDRAEAVQKQYDDAAMRGPTVAPTAPRPAPGKVSLEDSDPATQAFASADTAVPTTEQAPQQASMPVEEWKQRTARSFPAVNEKDPYRYIGPANDQGDHGYGKYRVMGASIAPWTEQYLGVKLTPRQFLGSEKAQEALASARGSDLMSKYGPDGAAAAWFVGENNMNGDPERPNLKLHVDEYVKRFNIPLADRDQITASAAGGDKPIQLASLGGVPTPDTPPDPREAVAQTLTGPPPQQVAQAPGPSVPPLGARPVQPAPTTDQGIRPIPAMPTRADPGPEPTRTSVIPPAVRAEMDHWSRVRANPYVSSAVTDYAKDKFDKLQSQMNDEYTKQWTHWRNETDRRETERLAYPEKQIDLETKTLGAEAKRRELEGEGFIPLTKDEMAGLFPPGSPPPPQGQIYFKNRKGELKWGPTPPASTSVSVETKGETAFEQTRGKALADHFVKSFEQGQDAIGDLQTITELRERAAKVGNTGASAALQELMGRWGIKTQGLGDIQAFSSLINRLAPQQRVPGTGASSDFDVRTFMAALPKLMNTPEGNQMILDTMERLTKNKMDRAEIAGAVVAGSMTAKEGVIALNKLQADARAHSDGIKAYLEQQEKTGGGSAIPAGTIQENKSTGQRRIMRPNGQWEIMPSGQ